MDTFYSPNGNPEVWETKPNGYLTVEEWLEQNPPEVPEVIETEINPSPSILERMAALEETILAMMLGGANA